MSTSKKDPDGALKDLLAEYVNGRLAPDKRRQVDAWLETSPQAREELQSWQRIYSAMQDRPLHTPSRAVWLTIERQVMQPEKSTQRGTAGLLEGFVLAAITLLLLWWALRPGVLLEWTVSGDSLAAYRIYRSPGDGHEFVLLGEVAGKPGEVQYRFLDALFLPGQQYIYQVEGVTSTGVSIVSQRVASQPMAALPGQLAILISSLVLGVLAAVLVRNWGASSPHRLIPA